MKRFQHDASRRAVEHMDLATAQAAGAERVAYIEEFSGAHALARKLSNDELDTLMDETEHLAEHIENLKAGGAPRERFQMVHPTGPNTRRAGRAGAEPEGMGWKRGHWGGPVIRQLGPEGAKALTSGSVVVPSLTGGIVGIPDRPALVTDVIPTDQLDSTNTASYLQETVRTLNATEVAEGTLKPTSTLTVAKIDEPARTIATLSQPVNRHDLDDAALLSAYIDGSLSQAVRLRLDGQIMNGNGTAPNLRGMLNVAGIQTQAFSVSAIETARKALSKLYSVEIPGGVYVIPVAVWEGIELAQNVSGAYQMQPGGGAPVDLAARRLWGQRVVVSSVLSSTTCILFNPGYTRLWERESIRVDWSEAPVGSVATESAFKSDELMFRAEGRWAFGVTRPTAVVSWVAA